VEQGAAALRRRPTAATKDATDPKVVTRHHKTSAATGGPMPAHWKPVDPRHGKLGKFANKLREVVHLRGVAPAEIAFLAGVSRATIYAVLAGERLPSVELLDCILGVRFPDAAKDPKPLPRRLSPRTLTEQRDRLERDARHSAPPPARPVHVGATPEQKRFTDALNEWVEKYRNEFPYYWPEGIMGQGGVSRGWLQRFLEGRAIPSEHGLGSLTPQEKPPGMEKGRWLQCLREHEKLHVLAFEAHRARRAAQAVVRTLQNGTGKR
jgi:transcriptional regulator with XRE-family HTH domain